MSTETVVQYAEAHFTDFVEDLKKLVRIPSVSAEGFPPEELERSADAVASLFKSEGLENVEILRIDGAPPYIYADWLHAPGKPTVLLYAHHDVQPAGREALWTEPPFEPVEKNGRLTGRGSADDKAGLMVHVSAVRSFLKTVGKLPVNVKFLIEGEEEVGSSHLLEFLKKYTQKMKADLMVLTDTVNFDTGIPTITTSLRGIVALDVEVKAMKGPLHSGLFGGPCPDPVMALMKMVSSLVDDRGEIAIKEIHEKVRPLNSVENESLKSLGYNDQKFAQEARLLPGVQVVGGSEMALVKVSRLPALTVNAIEASSRKDVSNRINESAWCHISVRTVPDMDGRHTLDLIKKHLKAVAPWGVTVEFPREDIAGWWITNPEGKYFELAKTALTEAFGRKCVFLGQGGSIPFVTPFAEALGGVPSILIGLEDPYTNAHAENESLDLGDFKKAIRGAILLYQKFSDA
jgi:acetylornithine deacetylase/succinyl-diaminopimelate desuccinylase-like protein